MNIFDRDMDNSDRWFKLCRVAYIGWLVAIFLSGAAHWWVWGIATVWWLGCIGLSYMTFPSRGR